MKKIVALCLGALLAIIWGCSQPPTKQESESFWEVWSRIIPNPGDSIIIESKTLNVGTGSPAAVVQVFITNKDTLENLTLALVERSLSGGAYMALSYPRDYYGIVTPLTSTLQFYPIFSGIRYNSSSPDTFSIAGFCDPRDLTTAEPPNFSRKAMLEIKFDTVLASPAGGSLEFDTTLIRNTNAYVFTCFVNLRFNEIKANFVKGMLNIEVPNSSSAILDEHKTKDPR